MTRRKWATALIGFAASRAAEAVVRWPHSFRVNWGHPLLAYNPSNLLGCWVFSQAIPYDLTGRNGYLSGITAEFSGGAFGPGLRFSGGTEAVLKGSGPIAGGLSNWTIIAGIQTTAATSPSGRPVYSERAASGFDILNLQTMVDSVGTNQVVLTYRNDAGTLYRLAGSKVLNDGRVHQVIITKGGLEAATSSRGFHNYTDGALDDAFESGSVPTNDNFTDAGVETWVGGDKGDATAQFEGIINYIFVLGTALPVEPIDARANAVVKELAANPFSFLEHKPTTSFFGGSGFPSGILNNPILVR